MCNKEHLIAYVYGELSPAETAAFDAHAAECAGCREELAGLLATRQHLASWSPPEADVDFAIVRTAHARAPVPRRLAFVPQWALAAAATLLILAGAAAIANVEMRYGPDGLVVRTGWGAAGATPPVALPAAAPEPQGPSTQGTSDGSAQVAAAIAALQARLDGLETREPPRAQRTAAAGDSVSSAELRRILAESESRHRTEMALQIAQIWKDFNAVRARDFARVQDVVGRAQGQTNLQLKQHRDSIESLYRVSFQQK